MNGERAVAVRTRYQARPGRRAIVIADLASLRGPSHGTVELPLRLYWNGPSPVFDRAMVAAAPAQGRADVDLFTDQEHGVEAAADAVESALRSAGFEPVGTHEPDPAGPQHPGYELGAQAGWDGPETEL